MSKKFIIFLGVSFLVVGLIGANIVFGQNNVETTTTTTTKSTETEEDPFGLGKYPVGSFQEATGEAAIKPGNLLVTALNWVFNIVLVISMMILIYTGFLYATAGGDQMKTKKAMSTLIYAIVGIAIAVGAQAIINLITVSIGAPTIKVQQIEEEKR